MSLTLRIPQQSADLAETINRRQGGPEAGLVFVASGLSLGTGWEAVSAELGEAFDLTKRAAVDTAPVVYVVSGGDLLGQNGPERAMVACGLLSGARTAALEGVKSRHTANLLAIESETPVDAIAEWIFRLLESHGTSGELIRIGAGHLGRALP